MSKKTMTKVRAYLDLDAEEAWVNEMAANGWLITRGGPIYRFTRTEPGHHAIRLDYRLHDRRANREEYLQFMADSGWRHLAGKSNQYFEATHPETDSELFSDQESRSKRYLRMLGAFSAILFYFVFCTWMYGRGTAYSVSTLLNPRGFFLTPGLWQMQGFQFQRHFYFELPFAMLRGLGAVIWPIGAAILIILIVRIALLRRSAEQTTIA
jgi:hypothetical protein